MDAADAAVVADVNQAKRKENAVVLKRSAVAHAHQAAHAVHAAAQAAHAVHAAARAQAALAAPAALEAPDALAADVNSF